jgi:hypothetical protein
VHSPALGRKGSALVTAAISCDRQVNRPVTEPQAVENVDVVELAGGIIGARRRRCGHGLEFVAT